MYITIVDSTIKEYKHNSIYISPTKEDAIDYVKTIMQDIIDCVDVDKYKKYAYFIIQSISTRDSIGYGNDTYHIAVDIMDKDFFDKNITETKEALEERIKNTKNHLESLRKKYDSLKK